MGPSPWQLLVILVIIILIFGTKKLRNMGGDLGGAIRGFKKSMSEDDKKEDAKTEDDSDVIEGKSEDTTKASQAEETPRDKSHS
jgi:sec-independent protein translocase protein TatA